MIGLSDGSLMVVGLIIFMLKVVNTQVFFYLELLTVSFQISILKITVENQTMLMQNYGFRMPQGITRSLVSLLRVIELIRLDMVS